MATRSPDHLGLLGPVITADVLYHGRLVGRFGIDHLTDHAARLVGRHRFHVGCEIVVVLRHASLNPLTMCARVETVDSERAALDIELQPSFVTRHRLRRFADVAVEQAPQPTRILVVDRDTDARAALVRELGELIDVTCVTATAPLEAVRHIEHERFHTVFVNVDQNDGVPLLAYFAERASFVRRIAIAASDDGTLVASGRAHALLRTPWDRVSLVETLRQSVCEWP